LAEDWREERQDGGGGEAERGFGGDSGGVRVSRNVLVVGGLSRYACLFTFWPPGPEEREKVISDRWRGMVSGFRSASHLRAAARSSSE
jgi:hypothetical protein